jgi:hypothetical protein
MPLWLEWLINFMVIWLCLDVLIIVVIWGFTALVRPRCPNWWRRVIADEDPYDY